MRHAQSSSEYNAEYNAWYRAVRRCHVLNDAAYASYGGRGIYVCVNWRGVSGFDCFFADMGPRPTRAHSLERKDNNGPYSPTNCIWATREAQANNRRSSRYLTMGGETRSISQWCRMFGVAYSTAWRRIALLGWHPIDAVSRPARRLACRG